jgi:16S rRNA (uracil1498-N3)-methyltransferase
VARFFVDRIVPPVVALSPEESKHAARVLRMSVGDRVTVFDAAEAWEARIESLGPPVTLRLLEQRPRPSLPRVIVAAAVPKGARLDWMVEKLAELGVAQFQPVEFARSVAEAGDAKRRRLEKIALAAAKQSGAPVMAIGEACDVQALPGDAVLASPGAVDGFTPGAATVVIGPEGGLTPDEEARFSRRASLGATILRIETAAVVAAARCLA